MQWVPGAEYMMTPLRTVIHKSQPNSLINLTFRSHHETFTKEAGTQFLRILMWRSTDKRTEYQLLLMKVSWWDRNVKVIKEFGCDLWIIVRSCCTIPTKWIYFSKEMMTPLPCMLCVRRWPTGWRRSLLRSRWSQSDSWASTSLDWNVPAVVSVNTPSIEKFSAATLTESLHCSTSASVLCHSSPVRLILVPNTSSTG